MELKPQSGPGSETSTSTELASHSQSQTSVSPSMLDMDSLPPRGDPPCSREPETETAGSEFNHTSLQGTQPLHVSPSTTSTSTKSPPKDRDQPLPPSSDQPMGSGPADQDLAVAGSAGSEPSHLSPSKTNESSTARCFRLRLQGICVSCGRDIPEGGCY